MTVHDLHDALNYLPSDLITAADKIRTAPEARVYPWRKWAAMAAMLVLVIGTAMVFSREFYPYMSDVKKESAAEAPAAMAPPMENQITADESVSEAPMGAGMAEIPVEEAAGSENGTEEELCIDHSHNFAEEAEDRKTTAAYCGNMLTTVYLDGMDYTLAGRDSVILTDILSSLNYDPDTVCRCITEFTVDTETLTGIHVNLTEGFARCEKGQAALTEKQTETIRVILSGLE